MAGSGPTPGSEEPGAENWFESVAPNVTTPHLRSFMASSVHLTRHPRKGKRHFMGEEISRTVRRSGTRPWGPEKGSGRTRNLG
jgi:hypothetical protein